MVASQHFLRALIVAGAILGLVGGGYGRPVAIGRETPVAEVIARVQTWIQAHPKNGEGQQVLGRVHALAWAYGEKVPVVSVGNDDGLPTFAEFSSVLVTREGPGEPRFDGDSVRTEDRKDRPVTAAEAQHMTDAIAAYQDAIRMSPQDALSELGLAWMLAQQGKYACALPADHFAEAGATDAEVAAWLKAAAQLSADDAAVREKATKGLLTAMPKCARFLRNLQTDDPETKARIDGIFRSYFDQQALEHYRKAYELKSQADLKGEPNYDVNSQISAAAGNEMLAILGEHPELARKGEMQNLRQVQPVLKEKKERLLQMPQ